MVKSRQLTGKELKQDRIWEDYKWKLRQRCQQESHRRKPEQNPSKSFRQLAIVAREEDVSHSAVSNDKSRGLKSRGLKSKTVSIARSESLTFTTLNMTSCSINSEGSNAVSALIRASWRSTSYPSHTTGHPLTPLNLGHSVLERFSSNPSFEPTTMFRNGVPSRSLQQLHHLHHTHVCVWHQYHPSRPLSIACLFLLSH